LLIAAAFVVGFMVGVVVYKLVEVGVKTPI